ncbi:MAG TPA: Arm DNA-binding domain-containing protein [Terracidiphilus sp.]
MPAVQSCGAGAYRFDGKEKLMALGEYPVVNLVEARERQFVARKKLAGGVDPMAERKAEAECHQREAEARQRQAENSFENIARKWWNGDLPASLRVTLTMSCEGWKRMSTPRSVTSLSMT